MTTPRAVDPEERRPLVDGPPRYRNKTFEFIAVQGASTVVNAVWSGTPEEPACLRVTIGPITPEQWDAIAAAIVAAGGRCPTTARFVAKAVATKEGWYD